MIFAIPFPDISPEIFAIELGGFALALRWYALAYIVGLIGGAFALARLMARGALWPQGQAPIRPDQVESLLTYIVLGVILGGRLGYVLFYQPSYYLAHPAEIPMIWQGGMAFHGGFLGVVVAVWLFARANGASVLSLGDGVAMMAPLGIGLGRIANFINAELWGRPTDAPFGVIFPGEAAQDCAGPAGLVELAGQILCARHPSQLYEAVLEGLILGLVMLYLAFRRGWLARPAAMMGVFLAGYGLGRFIVEFFRQPDAQFFETHPRGYVVALNDMVGLSMGQVLSLPMIVIGLAVILFAFRRRA